MMKEFLIKTTHQKLLAYFAEHPGQPIHERALVRKTKLAAGAVNKALNELLKAEVLSREARGKTYLYALRGDPTDMRIFRVLLMLWRLERLVNALRDVSRQVILYGSASRGTYDEQSDVDLLIVAPLKREALTIVQKFQDQLRKEGVRLQPVVKTTAQWARAERDDSTYYQEVLAGLTLWERPHAEQ
jgi:predicted nucleotidyltransferase